MKLQVIIAERVGEPGEEEERQYERLLEEIQLQGRKKYSDKVSEYRERLERYEEQLRNEDHFEKEYEEIRDQEERLEEEEQRFQHEFIARRATEASIIPMKRFQLLERPRRPNRYEPYIDYRLHENGRWILRLESLERKLELKGESSSKTATKLHQDYSRRTASRLANPYLNMENGFHITFYERSDSVPPLESYHNWKTGYLFENPRALGRHEFRQSAFTMLAIARYPDPDLPQSNLRQTGSKSDWTILLLSPPGFFTELPQEQSIINLVCGHRPMKETAELAWIVVALKRVVDRWKELNSYIADLLSEDFMEPDAYVKLLFDDESFTRSRRYFWIIGCVHEFEISITDNIEQWELFREARITPLYKHLGSGSPDAVTELERVKALAEEATVLHETLENLRSQFQNQLRTAQAWRDGLFNASALVESRASTRLGENVKLLTYISIFYLPLAFCAALWAVPNMTDSGTRDPFILTAVIVSFVTYMIVFNLGNIAQLFGQIYHKHREKLANRMKQDPKKFWNIYGERFGEFRPDNRKTASGWLLFVYQIRALTWKRQEKSNPQPHLQDDEAVSLAA